MGRWLETADSAATESGLFRAFGAFFEKGPTRAEDHEVSHTPTTAEPPKPTDDTRPQTCQNASRAYCPAATALTGHTVPWKRRFAAKPQPPRAQGQGHDHDPNGTQTGHLFVTRKDPNFQQGPFGRTQQAAARSKKASFTWHRGISRGADHCSRSFSEQNISRCVPWRRSLTMSTPSSVQFLQAGPSHNCAWPPRA